MRTIGLAPFGRCAFAGLLLMLSLTTVAEAQPRRPDERGPNGPPRQQRPTLDSPEATREALERRIQTLRRQQQILEEGLGMLDEGSPLPEVREHVRSAMADDLLDRTRAFRDRGGPRRLDRDEAEPQPGRPEADRPLPDTEDVLQALREVNPNLHERLLRAKEQDPAAFEEMVRRAGQRFRHLVDEKEQAPERWQHRVRTFRLERRAADLARQAAAGEEANRAAATEELRSVVGQLFDLRTAAQSEEIDRLSERLETSRSRLDSAIADRDRLIDERVAEMVRAAESGETPPPPQPERGRRAPPR